MQSTTVKGAFSSQVNIAMFRLWTTRDSQSARANRSALPKTDTMHRSPWQLQNQVDSRYKLISDYKPTWRLFECRQYRTPRARAARALERFCVVQNIHQTSQPMLTAKYNRPPLRGSRQSPGQHGDISIVDNTKLSERAREFCVAHHRHQA